MVEPVVMEGYKELILFTQADKSCLPGIPVMVIRDCHIGRAFLDVCGAIALDLVSIASSSAIEEVIIMQPDIHIRCIQRDSVVREQHHAQITDLHIPRVSQKEAPSVCIGILSDALKRHVHL